MEIKGIDVSSWNGLPDWKEAAGSGIRFAILRITQRYGIDTSFEHNYKGCRDNRIPVGVYKFSYALSPKEIREEAEGVIKTLKGRSLDFPVWLDLEWQEQRKLGSALLTEMAEEFRKIIVDAGYLFGIYCNVDWYQNVIPAALKKYEFWIAAYPYNDDGTIHESLRPKAGVGWQYSSKGRIPGISGNVDLDVFYKDYKGENQPEPGPEVPPSQIPPDAKLPSCRRSTTPKWVGEVTADWLNVRTWAGKEYPLMVYWPGLKKGNLVDVCDSLLSADGNDWYYIRIAGKYYGFVSARYIKRK